eukprot:155296-Prymnesium_polylepis.1
MSPEPDGSCGCVCVCVTRLTWGRWPVPSQRAFSHLKGRGSEAPQSRVALDYRLTAHHRP